MKRALRWNWVAVAFAAFFAAAGLASAQTAPQADASQYQVGREVTLVGMVSSVVENSKTGPLGTHVVVQSASGLVDVHVGSAKYLDDEQIGFEERGLGANSR